MYKFNLIVKCLFVSKICHDGVKKLERSMSTLLYLVVGIENEIEMTNIFMFDCWNLIL